MKIKRCIEISGVGTNIRLDFWPKEMYITIGEKNNISEVYRKVTGSDDGSLKLSIKSIMNLFSDKWEISHINELKPATWGNCKCDNHIEVMYNADIKKSKSAKKVK